MTVSSRLKAFVSRQPLAGFMGGITRRLSLRPLGRVMGTLAVSGLLLGMAAGSAQATEFENTIAAKGIQTAQTQYLNTLEERLESATPYVVLDADSIRMEASFALIGGVTNRDTATIIDDTVYEQTGARLSPQELRLLQHRLFDDVGDDVRSIVALRDHTLRTQDRWGNDVCIITPADPDMTKEMAWENLMNWPANFLNNKARSEMPDVQMYQRIVDYQAVSECADHHYAPMVNDAGYNYEERVFLTHKAMVFADVHAALMLAQDGHGWQPADVMADLRTIYTQSIGDIAAQRLADQEVVERYAGTVYYTSPALKAVRNYLQSTMQRDGADAPTKLSDADIYQLAVRFTEALSLDPEQFTAIHNRHRFGDRYKEEMRSRARAGGVDAFLYQTIKEYDGAVVQAIDKRFKDGWRTNRDTRFEVKGDGPSAQRITDYVIDRAARQPGWEPYAAELVKQIDQLRGDMQRNGTLQLGKMQFLSEFGDRMNSNVLRIQQQLKEKSAQHGAGLSRGIGQ